MHAQQPQHTLHPSANDENTEKQHCNHTIQQQQAQTLTSIIIDTSATGLTVNAHTTNESFIVLPEKTITHEPNKPPKLIPTQSTTNPKPPHHTNAVNTQKHLNQSPATMAATVGMPENDDDAEKMTKTTSDGMKSLGTSSKNKMHLPTRHQPVSPPRQEQLQPAIQYNNNTKLPIPMPLPLIYLQLMQVIPHCPKQQVKTRHKGTHHQVHPNTSTLSTQRSPPSETVANSPIRNLLFLWLQ